MNFHNFGAMPQVMTAKAVDVKEVVNENQFLDFENNRVQQLTLEQLMRTNRENNGNDNSPAHGIYHFALINQILEMAKANGYDAEMYDLFATNNRDKQTPGVSLYPKLEKKYGERAIEAHTLRRVYANIRLTDFDDDETTTNLAVVYTQKGLQVGFGTNVKVCHNQNMMGSGRFVADYNAGFSYAHGDKSVTDLKGIIATIGSWLTNAPKIVAEDREQIERMKNIVIAPEELYKIIGLLSVIRVAHDTSREEIRQSGNIYPLNQTQLNQFTERLLLRQYNEHQITAWAMYNCATDLYKPQTTETNNILTQNLSFYNFMQDYEIIPAV